MLSRRSGRVSPAAERYSSSAFNSSRSRNENGACKLHKHVSVIILWLNLAWRRMAWVMSNLSSNYYHYIVMFSKQCRLDSYIFKTTLNMVSLSEFLEGNFNDAKCSTIVVIDRFWQGSLKCVILREKYSNDP